MRDSAQSDNSHTGLNGVLGENLALLAGLGKLTAVVVSGFPHLSQEALGAVTMEDQFSSPLDFGGCEVGSEYHGGLMLGRPEDNHGLIVAVVAHQVLSGRQGFVSEDEIEGDIGLERRSCLGFSGAGCHHRKYRDFNQMRFHVTSFKVAFIWVSES